VGWRFIHGPVAKGRRTGNERRHKPEPPASPSFFAAGSFGLEITSPSPETARPAQVTLATAAGLHATRGVYQSGSQLFWRAIAAELSGTITATAKITEIAPLLTRLWELADDHPADHTQKKAMP
jgi:hypothetical protein